MSNRAALIAGSIPTCLGRPSSSSTPSARTGCGAIRPAVADGATAVAVDGLPRCIDRWAALDVRVAWQEHARLVPGLRPAPTRRYLLGG